MSSETKKEVQLEIAHVLFIDIVGYSKLLLNEQRALLDSLNQIVRGTDQFKKAEAAGRLIKIPTGDGMALVFYQSPEEPVECALEISSALKEHPELHLRMGVHSGPVSGVVDVNERANVAGAGINMAQRVMDCGDAGHILLSKHVAVDLQHSARWQPLLHDLGEVEAKHGVRVLVVNLYNDEVGNPAVPEKFVRGTNRKAVAAAPSNPHRYPIAAIAVTGLTIIGALLAWKLTWSRAHFHVEGGAPATPDSQGLAGVRPSIPEKSIAVLPFDNLSAESHFAHFGAEIQKRAG
jgi:class 3 adenylate cyclase